MWKPENFMLTKSWCAVEYRYCPATKFEHASTIRDYDKHLYDTEQEAQKRADELNKTINSRKFL